MARFESMSTEAQKSSDLAFLQHQVTPEAIDRVLVYSVIASDVSTSCNMSTKVALGMETLP